MTLEHAAPSGAALSMECPIGYQTKKDLAAMQTIIFTSKNGFGDNTAYVEVTPDGQSFRMGMKDGQVTYWLREDGHDESWLSFGKNMVAQGKWDQAVGAEYVPRPAPYFVRPQVALKMLAGQP